jgi:NitT/TauT family transport system permease protein
MDASELGVLDSEPSAGLPQGSGAQEECRAETESRIADGKPRAARPRRSRLSLDGVEPFLPLLMFAAICGIWELLTVAGVWSPAAFPGPGKVLASLWELLRTGVLVKHAVASLFRVTLGFYLAVGLGLPLGMLLGQWRSGREALNSLIQFLRPISPLAWIPLAMLWFGIGDKPAIFLIFLSSFFPLVVSTIVAVRQINSTYFRVASNFGLSPWERVTHVVVPAILPAILPALRISLGIAWLVVVAAEMIAVKSGLGYLILDARNALRMDIVVAAMVAIGLIGVVLDRVVSKLNQIESMSWGLR